MVHLVYDKLVNKEHIWTEIFSRKSLYSNSLSRTKAFNTSSLHRGILNFEINFQFQEIPGSQSVSFVRVTMSEPQETPSERNVVPPIPSSPAQNIQAQGTPVSTTSIQLNTYL